MSDLTAKFVALEEQLTAQHTSVMELLGEMSSTLGNIEVALDIQINNAATNTRALLDAIKAGGACIPCETPSLTVPPLVSGETGVDIDKCKRTQAFLHAMEQVYTTADIISGFGVGWSPSLYTDAMGQVIAGFDTGDTPDTPSWPEANQIVNYAIEYGIGNFLVGETLSNYFATVRGAAQTAIYAATDIAGDKAAYEAVLAGSALPGYAQGLLGALAYQNLYNYYFDSSSSPNLTGFGGFECGNAECFDVESDGAFEVFVGTEYLGWTVTGFDDGCCTDYHNSNGFRARRWTSEAIFEVLGVTTADDPPAYTNHHGPGYYFGRGCCNTPYTLTFCPPE